MPPIYEANAWVRMFLSVMSVSHEGDRAPMCACVQWESSAVQLAIRFITPTLYLWTFLLSPHLSRSLLFPFLKHLHLFLFFPFNQWPSPFLLLFPLSWQLAFAEFSIFGSAFTQIFLHLPSSPPRFISLPSSLSLSLACYSSPSFSTFSLHPLPPKFPLSLSFSFSRCSTH